VSMDDLDAQEEVESEEPVADELDLGLDLSPEEQAAAEEMVAHLRQQLSLDEPEQEEVEETEPDEEAEAEPEPEVEQELAVARHAPATDRLMIEGHEYVVIDGAPYSVEQIRAQAQAPRVEPSPVQKDPPVPVAPEWLDTEDPAQAFFWKKMQDQDRALQAVAANQQKINEDQTRERLVNEVQSGLSTFRQAHPELTEDDVQVIRLHATSLNIVGGLAAQMDGPAAVRKALDIAYLDHPEYRAQHQGEPKPSEVKAKASSERKAKLGALSGSSGSAPRQPEAQQKPSTDREMRAQAAKWLSEQGILPNQ
jgi:hypothetical protein